MPTQGLIRSVPMGIRDFEATIAFLAERPIDHAGLLSLARRAQSTISLRRQFVLACDSDARICGVMFTGLQTMLSHAHVDATTAFARLSLQQRPIRALIGPEETVTQFIAERSNASEAPPHLDTIQDLYVLRTLALEPVFFADHVAEANTHDLDNIVIGAATMICEELDYDPRRRPTFRREILNQIQGRRWWIAQDPALRLLCRIGATTTETMQLECIWSPPESRGLGHATRSLATICAHLLKRRSSLSLAVNTTNARAIKLYERLGFVKYSTQRTLLW